MRPDDPYEALWSTNGGIFLGFEQTGYTTGMDGKPFQAITDQHIFLTGPQGSGKTRRFIINNMRLLTGWTIVSVNIKHDIYAGTAEHRREQGCEEILIDPFGVNGKSAGHNPVAALSLDDDLIDESAGLAAVTSPIESLREPHFDVAAQDLAQAIILHTRIMAKPKHSLLAIRDVIGQEDKAIGTWAADASVEGIYAKWPEIARKLAGWVRFGEKDDDRERQSVLASLRNKTRWMDSRRIAEDLQKCTTDWSILRDRPHSIYITLPANRLASHSSWLKLILNSIMQRLLADSTPPKVPILFVLDEASFLAGIPSIEQNMALMRGYGIKLLSVYQDIGQAKLALNDPTRGMSRLSSYTGNSGVIMGFAPQEFETGQFLADQGGKRTGRVFSHSGENSIWTLEQGQLNVAQQQVDAILPQEIIDLPEGYAIAFVKGRRGPLTLYCPDPSEVPDLARRVGGAS